VAQSKMKTPLTPSLADAMIDDREFIDAGSKSFRQLQAHSLQHSDSSSITCEDRRKPRAAFLWGS
jgi:hypothetical protein